MSTADPCGGNEVWRSGCDVAGVEACEALVGFRLFAAGGCEVTESEGRFLGFGRLAEEGYGGDCAGER